MKEVMMCLRTTLRRWQKSKRNTLKYASNNKNHNDESKQTNKQTKKKEREIKDFHNTVRG